MASMPCSTWLQATVTTNQAMRNRNVIHVDSSSAAPGSSGFVVRRLAVLYAMITPVSEQHTLDCIFMNALIPKVV
jgi:hypothetical protein